MMGQAIGLFIQLRIAELLSGAGECWEVRCTGHGARVRKGATRRAPDVTISTDSDTWMRLREGEFSGVEAFQRRR